MKFTWYIAGRYFRGKNRDSRFLSFIKFMAIAGVAIGSAGLLIALSIVHGFKSTINEKIVGFAPHVTVSTFMPDQMQRADTLQTFISDFPGVANAQPAAIGEVMIQSVRDISGTVIKGVNPVDGDVTRLQEYIIAGNYTFEENENGLPGIILGSSLAREIGADIGDRVTAYALDGLPTPFNTPEIQQFHLQQFIRQELTGLMIILQLRIYGPFAIYLV